MKYNYAFLLFSVLLLGKLKAQENYSNITGQAIVIINEQDSTKYQKAYDLFEKAFENFSDSINGTGLYYASILNAELKNYDKAFQYLSPLAKMEKDEDGYPGWSFVLDEYAEEDYKNLMGDKRWKALKIAAQRDSLQFFKKLKEREQEFFRVSTIDIAKSAPSENIYKAIRTHNPYILKEHRNYSISLRINDSTATSYLVHLPNGYNPQKKYPVLFFLHGAVRF
ncbi:MAG: hypothetical protein AB3N16_01525, partial [Flavobacteriaceae bacterium]